ncbi:hypothetical protein PRIPAC_86630 [Pristionchus pacificus]|uniref:INTS8 TPR repeats domain-containing protein n=1 Tax=Pristionchus pacificus TaxID=54126 RepID=A0A2A6BNP2_PRIPA|nr:hypothetical protein PRIPAC_86630 [Pristionchus pacificus]|eukprot:PDM67535.1 hypothetical protein PRIPAC_48952 [Pristionchus pacificus]
MDIDISCVHELWAAPKENWLDHFVNTNRFKKLLNESPKSDAHREELRNLVIQFAEQAVQVEAETDTLIKKQFGQDDISFHQRKASCLWLCCLAAFAGIDWHFESLMEKTTDVILVNAIFDRIDAWKETMCNPSSIPFTSFLLSRWFLFVHNYFRIPPPEAKQTVSNPVNQLDVALQRFDHARAIGLRLRGRFDDSLRILEELATLATNEQKKLFVPRPDCFLDPFLQYGGQSLSIGIVGPNVLVPEDTLRPRVPSGDARDTQGLSTEMVVAKINFELMSAYFCAGKMTNALGCLKQVLKFSPVRAFPPSQLPSIIRFCERKLNGYAAAFRIPLPFPTATPSTSQAEVLGTITSTDACPRRVPQRKYGARRDRRAEQARPMDQPVSSIRLDPLAMCDDMWMGGPTVGWRAKMEKEGEEKRGKVVEMLRYLCSPPVHTTLSPAGRAIVRGIARFMIATGTGSQPLVDSLALPAPTVSLAGVRKAQPNMPPSEASIRSMAASDKPYWTLLTSFDAAELQAAYNLEGTQYTRPTMLSRWPESLADLLLQRRPVDELHALLLGKLQQLTEMGDGERWESCLNTYMGFFPTTQPLLEIAIFEATRVQMLCFNKQLLSPHSDLKQASVNVTRSVAMKLKKVSQVASCVAPDPKAKGQLPQLAQTWHSIISGYFEARASKRPIDGFTTMHLREGSRVRIELIKIYPPFKTSSSPTLRASTHRLQLAHMESLEEVITILLHQALSTEPHKATLLRTKADFAYVRNQLNEAAVSYCELMVAVKPSLTMPLTGKEGVIDDSVWNHLRICLRKNNQQTMAACVCQLFKTGRAKEFRKAAEAIQERACLDASDDCFGLIYDVQLAEALTDTYKKRGQQQKLEALIDVIASPTMNPNNGTEVVQREVRRKQKRLLNTLAAMHFGIHVPLVMHDSPSDIGRSSGLLSSKSTEDIQGESRLLNMLENQHAKTDAEVAETKEADGETRKSEETIDSLRADRARLEDQLAFFKELFNGACEDRHALLATVTVLNERIEQLTGQVHLLEYEMDLQSRLHEGLDGMQISTKVDEDVGARAIKAENNLAAAKLQATSWRERYDEVFDRLCQLEKKEEEREANAAQDAQQTVNSSPLSRPNSPLNRSGDTAGERESAQQQLKEMQMRSIAGILSDSVKRSGDLTVRVAHEVETNVRNMTKVGGTGTVAKKGQKATGMMAAAKDITVTVHSFNESAAKDAQLLNLLGILQPYRANSGYVLNMDASLIRIFGSLNDCDEKKLLELEQRMFKSNVRCHVCQRHTYFLNIRGIFEHIMGGTHQMALNSTGSRISQAALDSWDAVTRDIAKTKKEPLLPTPKVKPTKVQPTPAAIKPLSPEAKTLVDLLNDLMGCTHEGHKPASNALDHLREICEKWKKLNLKQKTATGILAKGTAGWKMVCVPCKEEIIARSMFFHITSVKHHKKVRHGAVKVCEESVHTMMERLESVHK